MNLGVICCHTGNLISILFKSTGIYSNIIYVTKAIVTSLTDKNSNKGKTKCRSKYWPIRVVKSNSAILPERKIKEKKFPWIQMIRIRKNVLISIKFLKYFIVCCLLMFQNEKPKNTTTTIFCTKTLL